MKSVENLIDRIICGDARNVLARIPDRVFQTCITSPPFFGLRDYNLEPTVWDAGDCDHEWGGNTVCPTKIGKHGSTETIKNPALVKSQCRHEWGEDTRTLHSGSTASDKAKSVGGAFHGDKVVTSAFCRLCGAWRGSLGLEPRPELYIQHLVQIFREVWRVLRDDGTCWINIGDSYFGGNSTGRQPKDSNGVEMARQTKNAQKICQYCGGSFIGYPSQRFCSDACGGVDNTPRSVKYGLKPKDMVLIPFRLALALQADGWWLRSTIIWEKKNCMPSSVRDRPTTSHEYVFLLAKSKKYYYDATAIMEPTCTPADDKSHHTFGASGGKAQQVYGRKVSGEHWQNNGFRNKRTVWTVPTVPFSGAKLIADYVGSDGKPYRASLDCPYHGHLAGTRNHETDECDGLQADELNRIPDKATGRVVEHPHESSAMPSHNAPDTDPLPIVPSQIDENNVGNRSDGRIHRDKPQKSHDNIHIQETSVASDSDSLSRACSGSATEHNKQSHKTARAPETTTSYKPSAEIPDHIGDTPELPLLSELCESMSGNNTLQDEKGAHSQGKTLDHTVDKSSLDITSYNKGSTAKCTCQVVSVDHFATFPPKLVEPMILAGSSDKACEHCGAAWVRTTKRVGANEANEMGIKAMLEKGVPRTTANLYTTQQRGHTETVGFQPSCDCEDNGGSEASIVLDCFAGSCTTGAVAKEHGRRYIMIEQNPDYVKLGEKRILEAYQQLRLFH